MFLLQDDMFLLQEFRMESFVAQEYAATPQLAIKYGDDFLKKMRGSSQRKKVGTGGASGDAEVRKRIPQMVILGGINNVLNESHHCKTLQHSCSYFGSMHTTAKNMAAVFGGAFYGSASHCPQVASTKLLAEAHRAWAKEFDVTSSHKGEQSDDMQWHVLMQGLALQTTTAITPHDVPKGWSPWEGFCRELHTNSDEIIHNSEPKGIGWYI